MHGDVHDATMCIVKVQSATHMIKQLYMLASPIRFARHGEPAAMAATARGVAAITKLVATGARPTCLRKKMGKKCLVMPVANPNSRSDVARRYGTECELSCGMAHLPLLVCSLSCKTSVASSAALDT